MNSGMMCPECLSECAMISTTRPEYLWCTKCDVRYTDNEAFTIAEVQQEMLKRLETWEEPKHWDYTCPNCKSTQRIALDSHIITGGREHPVCANCREKLVVRVPYSAFVK